MSDSNLHRLASGLEIKLKSLMLEQFRSFNKLPEFTFGDKLTVILSENGGGKTTILDAVSSSLQIFVNQLIGTGYSRPQILDEKNIKNEFPNAHIQLEIEIKKSFIDDYELDDEQESNQSYTLYNYDSIILDENKIDISINPERCEFRINEYIADDESVFSFGNYFRNEYREGDYLPILVYYGCNSIDTNSGLSKVIMQNKIYHLYADSLVSKRFSFDSFIRWFDYLYKTKQLGNEETNFELDLINKVAYTLLNDEDGAVFSNLRMSYQLDRESLLIDKTDKEGRVASIEINQMSSGEKIMFALAVDIAKRLIIANPDLLTNREISPLHGQGIVLIDEIDLHLHPKWQRLILYKLLNLFPNIQFVVTTHSPFVVQSVLPKYCVKLNNGWIESFEGDNREDYESIAIDFFGIKNFFDPETSKVFSDFREMVRNIISNKTNAKDPIFIDLIKNLIDRGDTVKSMLAFELSQMEKKLQSHDEN